MSDGYRAVQWNAYKVRYDVAVFAAIATFIITFLAVGAILRPTERAISPPVLLIRALGTCAFLMLHVVLCIGPLARLDRRFLPLLYNRRHLGVATFCVALIHGLLSIGFYHGFSDTSPLLSLLTSNTEYQSLSAFPFEILGLAAMAILFLLAVTSHDFWLKNLSPKTWKSLHMLVYLAWAAAVMHVALGALQSERSSVYPLLVGVGVFVVGSLHCLAGWREARRDSQAAPKTDWVDAGNADDIADRRARVVSLPDGECVAVFRHGNQLSAISNVCAHQGGPLGEGVIIDGCVTCPWHGYQYRPCDGRAPVPFTERVCSYRLKVSSGRILLDPTPLPPGTTVEPAAMPQRSAESSAFEEGVAHV